MSSQDTGGPTTISAWYSVSLHVLVAALGTVVLLNVGGRHALHTAAVVGVMVGFLATYGVGTWPTGAVPGPGRAGSWWVAALSVEWLVLLCLSVEASYLVFALFFLHMHVLGALRGTLAVVLATGIAVAAFGLHRGFDLAGVVGPLLGAGVAVTIALGHQALTDEVRHRQRLIEELTRTRGRLATAERAAGVSEERARLAREIHDTLSQSLSSIIMLLHAAQRSDPVAGADHQRLEQAREAAQEALAETREFIHALVPPSLRTGDITQALSRLARQTENTTGMEVELTVPHDTGPLPTPVEAGLLRIAQGAIANVAQHARARRIDVTLTRLDDEIILDVVDDGDGFDLARLGTDPGRPTFGLVAMEERVGSLGGTLVVESSQGHGTSVVASFSVHP